MVPRQPAESDQRDSRELERASLLIAQRRWAGCDLPASVRGLPAGQILQTVSPFGDDYHPHPLDRITCWGCRPEPVGVAATSRDWSLCRIGHRRDGPRPWRYSNPLPRDCVHARDDWRSRLAVMECVPHVVSYAAIPAVRTFRRRCRNATARWCVCDRVDGGLLSKP